MNRLAISNIAWSPDEDEAVAAVLRDRDVSLVEVAPTKRWPDPTRATPFDASRWRAEWEARGFRVASMQSLLFGRPDLVIFGDDDAREATLAYLEHVMQLAAALGAGPLVFGSPANRKVGAMPASEAQRIAVPWFARLGARARQLGVRLCIEPNPPQYGCDFLTDTASCARFLELVNEPGLGLHLDAAALHLNGERVEEAIGSAGRWLTHYHASEPFLAPLGSAAVRHREHARALVDAGYAGLVAIEMKPSTERPAAEHVASSVDVALDAYAVLLASDAPAA